jgi:hypothetical protein
MSKRKPIAIRPPLRGRKQIRLDDETLRRLDEFRLANETRADLLRQVVADYAANMKKYSNRFADWFGGVLNKDMRKRKHPRRSA